MQEHYSLPLGGSIPLGAFSIYAFKKKEKKARLNYMSLTLKNKKRIDLSKNSEKKMHFQSSQKIV